MKVLQGEASADLTLNESSSEMITKERWPFVDQLRGFAVLLMIIFHLCFDLNYFDYINVKFLKEYSPWWFFPRIIVLLFMFCVGLALPFDHYPKIKWQKMGKRILLLGILAGAISLVTYILIPDRWIYFGTLHSIATCTLLALPFLHYPKVGVVIALALLIPSMFFDKNIPWILDLPHASLDYIAPFPWVGFVLLGIACHHWGIHKINPLQNHFPFIDKSLEYMGKKSLIIYLLHQPILFGLVYLFYSIQHW